MVTQGERRIEAVLEPARLLRWVYIARMSLAWAILIAAIVSWRITDQDKTLIATIAFIVAHLSTFASYYWSDIRGEPLTEVFYYLQLIVDVLLVSGVVHVTDGQFAALYILVNTVAAILLPVGGALLITALSLVFYAGDVLLLQGAPPSYGPLVLQLIVFSLAGVGTSVIAVQLKAAGIGREALAAELTRVRLREADILRNIRSGIVSMSQAGELLFANESARDLLGIDVEATVGMPFLDDVVEAAPGLVSALRRAAADPVAGAGRTEGILRRGGLDVPLGVTTTATEDGAGTGTHTITAIFQDISDQKRLQQLHLRAQRLEAVTELSASLAHEIKNPLASIRSAIEQISTRPAASDDERVLGRLIVRESDRLSRLLSEFLDFARVRVTRQEPVDMSAVVRGACRLAEANPTKVDGASVRMDLADHPLIVNGDDDLLHRAVFNLTLNAVQATRPGTAVQVTVRAARPGDVPGRDPALRAGAVLIEVADHGPGIDAAVRERLFEPFTTTKPGGSGLGLAIAHRAIEAHKGVVLVDTGAQGTRFTVLLPLRVTTAGGDT